MVTKCMLFQSLMLMIMDIIYGHTKDGLKIQMMRNNPNVCFEIDWMKDMNNWKSVIAYGTFEELKGDDANKGLKILMKSIMSNLDRKSLRLKPLVMIIGISKILHFSTHFYRHFYIVIIRKFLILWCIELK